MIAFCMWFFFPVVALRLFKLMEIDKRPEKKFSQGFIATPAAQGPLRTNNRFPCLLAPQDRRVVRLLRIWCEGKGVSRGRTGGVA